MVMFNPRLASGDVGVGLSIRRMRESFLSRFTTTYSLRPIADVGSVFRRYPGMWQVFVQDAQVQGRYKLIAERLSRPGGEHQPLHAATHRASPVPRPAAGPPASEGRPPRALVACRRRGSGLHPHVGVWRARGRRGRAAGRRHRLCQPAGRHDQRPAALHALAVAVRGRRRCACYPGWRGSRYAACALRFLCAKAREGSTENV